MSTRSSSNKVSSFASRASRAPLARERAWTFAASVAFAASVTLASVGVGEENSAWPVMPVTIDRAIATTLAAGFGRFSATLGFMSGCLS